MPHSPTEKAQGPTTHWGRNPADNHRVSWKGTLQMEPSASQDLDGPLVKPCGTGSREATLRFLTHRKLGFGYSKVIRFGVFLNATVDS